MPVATKNDLIISVIPSWPEHILKNIWRKNVSPNSIHYSPSNIFWISCFFQSYFQIYNRSNTTYHGVLVSSGCHDTFEPKTSSVNLLNISRIFTGYIIFNTFSLKYSPRYILYMLKFQKISQLNYQILDWVCCRVDGVTQYQVGRKSRPGICRNYGNFPLTMRSLWTTSSLWISSKASLGCTL